MNADFVEVAYTQWRIFVIVVQQASQTELTQHVTQYYVSSGMMNLFVHNHRKAYWKISHDATDLQGVRHKLTYFPTNGLWTLKARDLPLSTCDPHTTL